MFKHYQLLTLCTILFIISCTAVFENGKELANDSRTRITEISVDSLSKIIDKQMDFLLIDVRQLAEYKKGNIEGSFQISRGVLEFQIGDSIFWEEQFMYAPEDTTQIVIYCQKGDRGVLAAEALMKLGYKNVANLKGGWEEFNPDFAATVVKEESGGCGG